jgi:mitogen-activated protein kinase kinase kinase 17/18
MYAAGEMRRLRTLGRGASGAVVSLFAAGEDEELLLAVKSAAGAAAQRLRREAAIMASLRSPHVLPCLGYRAAAGGEFQVLLDFAPGGSLADEAERNGGRLDEPAARAFVADVARGLAYLHGERVVHGDVKARNVVLGADSRAKLADFGCARRLVGGDGSSSSDWGPFLGGTPAFMAPEVARGEEQGPAADIWALGCTVIEMATGRAPWSHLDDVVAAVRVIGYTDAVPQAPEWLSAEAKDFLGKCLCRDASERWTAVRLLEHPFLLASSAGEEAEDVKAKWVSPKSTLDAALWESDEELAPESPVDRIRSLAGPCSALPEWESDDGWIEVCSSSQSELSGAAAACQEVKSTTRFDISDTAAAAAHSGNLWEDEPEADVGAAEPFAADLDAGDDDPVHNVAAAGTYAHRQQQDILENFTADLVVLDVLIPGGEEIVKACLPCPFAASVTLRLPLFVL